MAIALLQLLEVLREVLEVLLVHLLQKGAALVVQQQQQPVDGPVRGLSRL
jgi:hypothetical protein